MREKRVSDGLYLGMEALIYSAFLYCDITGRGGFWSPALKFCGIVLCVLFLLQEAFFRGGGRERRRNTDIKTVLPALVFTAAADVCLLLADFYVTGVCFFIAAQLFYLDRLSGKGVADRKYRTLAARLLFSASVLSILFLAGMPVDVLLAVTAFYFINLVHNTALAVRWAGQGGSVLFAAGLILFLLCDINVGIYNMSGYLHLGEAWAAGAAAVSGVAMWLFYLPSQVLITLSARFGAAPP